MDTRSLTEELLSKPALNGGFDRLVKQQDAQMVQLTAITKRVRSLTGWRKKWDRRWTLLLGLLGSTTVAIVAKVLVEILGRAKIIP